MKIGVITFHQALNYGALLQTYALQKFINDNFAGVETELIDYKCPYLSYLYSTKAHNSGNFVYRSLKKGHFLLKRRLFQSFIRNHIKISSPYTQDTIKNANKKYDKFIAGSDQIWNCNLTDSDMNYLLAFSDNNKRYSYAASIGLSVIPDEVTSTYTRELGMFNAISVRESHAIETISKLGETMPKIEQHVDPVLLLSVDQWNLLCAKKKQKKSKFILVFSVEYSNELIEEAVKFAKAKNMNVYYVGQRTRNPDVKYIPLISFEKLLALFRDASYIFVNSFHGTVLSVLYHKQFYARMVHTDGRNNRIISLLDKASLQSRTSITSIDEQIDWNQVDSILEAERLRSKKYIAGIISNEN